MEAKTDRPFSKHIFMFAFKWNYMNNKSNKGKVYRKYSDKVNLQAFEKLLNAQDREESPWKKCDYKEDYITDYNEYTYYYHNVRDAIYGGNKRSRQADKKVDIYEYQLKKEETLHYTIGVLIKDSVVTTDHTYTEKEYVLDVTKIELKTYDTGVGILSLFTENNHEYAMEAINTINNYGRRIYPQFIEKRENDLPTQKTKETFLANRHCLKLGKEETDHYIETYSSDYEVEGNRISNMIMGLLGAYFKTGKNALRTHKEEIIAVSPLIDDRMFVICFYANQTLSDTLKQLEATNQGRYYNYIQNDRWYEYVFMEQEKNCQSRWMLEDILKRHTYERWIEKGTLYGMSHSSFVCLTDGNEFGIKNIAVHMTTIYYQMMCLVLAQKASILRFEDELTDISNQSKNIPIEAVEEVYQNYLQFINGIYFREVTAEDQGIELYAMAQNIMRIDIDVKELKEEIGQLFQYVSLRADKETGKAINSLTYLNTLILVPSLVTGFFGMNIFGERMRVAWSIMDYKKLIVWVCIWIISVGILPLAIIRTTFIQKAISKLPVLFRKVFPWILAIAAILVSILLQIK